LATDFQGGNSDFSSRQGDSAVRDHKKAEISRSDQLLLGSELATLSNVVFVPVPSDPIAG
jgi:hypothetical protein